MKTLYIVTVFDHFVNKYLVDHNKIYSDAQEAEAYFDSLNDHMYKHQEEWTVSMTTGTLD